MKTDTKKETEIKMAKKLYAAAYGTHHVSKDLTRALRLYREFIASYPNAEEVGYAQSEINAILRIGFPRRNLVQVQEEEL